MANNQVDLSIVIPVYNSQETLVILVERLMDVLGKLVEKFEVILVDDGSVDKSWEIMEDLQRSWENQMVVVQLMRNFGQHNALMCGFRFASGKYVVTMDDDLQNPPEEINKLLRAINETGHDVVYGYYEIKKHNTLRNVATALVRFFYRQVFGVKIKTTSFRIMRKNLVDAIVKYDLNYTYIDGLLAWNTKRIGNVAVTHYARKVGSSGYSLGKLLLLALNLFTNFSIIPLQVVSFIGVMSAITGFGVGGYYLVQYFQSNIIIPGYASTITAILVLGGVQLLALGMMGEYLGRLHLNVNRKPQYVVRAARGRNWN